MRLITFRNRMSNHTKPGGVYLAAMLPALLLAAVLSSCRDDELVVYSDTQNIPSGTVSGILSGMYVLCEGNMGSNKATIDYLDLSAADGVVAYHRNIFSERNPAEVKELGDVGNDIQINSSGQMWIVVNCSNKVEIVSADSCRKKGKVDIPNCRYVTFSGPYAYISSYVGPVMVSGDAPLGRVYKVDTLNFKKVDSVTVGYQPEEMAVVGNKLYVANSGGYRVPDYDRTVSVIDLATFREERKIDVAANLHRLRADARGQLWVTSRGDYWGSQPRLYWLGTGQDGEMRLEGELPVAVSDMCIVGDSLYFIGSNWSASSGNNVLTYGIVDVAAKKVMASSLSASPEMAGIVMPYGIKVNPKERDFYIMDAKDYLSSGQLYHFKADGTFDWCVWTGDVPGHAAFVYAPAKQ